MTYFNLRFQEASFIWLAMNDLITFLLRLSRHVNSMITGALDRIYVPYPDCICDQKSV